MSRKKPRGGRQCRDGERRGEDPGGGGEGGLTLKHTMLAKGVIICGSLSIGRGITSTAGGMVRKDSLEISIMRPLTPRGRGHHNPFPGAEGVYWGGGGHKRL